MVKEFKRRQKMEKRAIIVARLVPKPEAYEGKSNKAIAEEIKDAGPALPYVAEIERISVFNSLSGAAEPKSPKEMVMTSFKPVH